MHVGAGIQLSRSYSLHWGKTLVTRVRPPVGSVAQCIFYRAEIFSLAVCQRMLEERTEWGDLPSTCWARVIQSLLGCPQSQVSAQGGVLWDSRKRKVGQGTILMDRLAAFLSLAFFRDCSNCKIGMSEVEELASHTYCASMRTLAWSPRTDQRKKNEIPYLEK